MQPRASLDRMRCNRLATDVSRSDLILAGRRLPVEPEQLVDALGWSRVEACQDVGEVRERIDVVRLARGNDGVEGGEIRAGFFVADEQKVFPSKSDDSQRILGAVVVWWDVYVWNVACEGVPISHCMANRDADLALGSVQVLLFGEPDAEFVHERERLFPTQSRVLRRTMQTSLADVVLAHVDVADDVECELRLGLVFQRFEELSSGVRHAARAHAAAGLRDASVAGEHIHYLCDLVG